MSEGRHTPRSARLKPAYLIAGGAGLIVVIVVAILLFVGDGSIPLVGGSDGQSPTATGGFAFKLEPYSVLTTAPDANANKATKAAKPAAAAAEKLIHDFYVSAFLDPGKWIGGAYEGVFDVFSKGARAQAMQKIEVMTAGAAAADTYESIAAKNASLREKVLMDTNGQPYSVVGVVTFTATAVMKEGGAVTLISRGQYILEKAADGWRITSFSVTRDDEAAASPTVSGSATPTAAAS